MVMRPLGVWAIGQWWQVDEQTMLMLAASRGHTSSVITLLTKGANIEGRDEVLQCKEILSLQHLMSTILGASAH